MKKVIIVGGGLGGLSSALRLLHHGYHVTIFEKEATVGGRINQLKTTEGYTFDLTASILLLKQPLIELFEDLNLCIDDYLQMTELENIYRVFYKDDIISVPKDISKCLNVLEQSNSKDAISFLNFLSEGYEKLILTNQSFLTQRFETKKDFFNVPTLLKGIKLKPFQTSAKCIQSFEMSDWLSQYLIFQSMYVGINPYRSQNVYTILPVGAQLYGLTYIKHGLYEMIRVMKNLIVEKGGEIVTNAAVSKICVEDESVIGVCVNGQYVSADYVIINTDVTYANRVLLNQQDFDPLESSCSIFILYLGIKKKLESLDVHNIYLGPHFKRNMKAAFVGKIPLAPSLYIYCPSKIDESMAKSGCETVSVTVRMPHLGQHSDWKKCDKFKIRTYIVKTLSKILKMPDLESLIDYESDLTPVDLYDRFNSFEGNAFGAQHSLNQTTYFRPHHISDQFKNLYYVGASTHPGTGITLVLKGAALVVEQITSIK